MSTTDFVTNPHTGSKFVGGPENIIPYLINEIFEEQCYETGIETFDTVLDLGANIGVAADYFRTRANQVYCVEAVNENFKLLNENCTRNNWRNVSCFNRAIWITDGENLTFSEGNDRSNCHRSENVSSPIGVGSSITIKTLLDELDLSSVDLIKMDIEGAEVEVMTDPNFKDIVYKTSNWLIEIHNHEYDRLSNIMTKFGFEHKVLAGFDLVNPTVHFYV
jgi:FkbM family methyltransferase